MSPVSRRRQTRRPKQQWQGTRLLPLGDAAAATADVPGACSLLIDHLDGRLARRGITAEAYVPLLMGMATLVGAFAERLGAGPEPDPDEFRRLLTEIRDDPRLTAEFGGKGSPPT